MSALTKFIAGHCLRDPKARTSTRDLREAWIAADLPDIAPDALGRKFSKAGFERCRHGTGSGWKGIRLKPRPGPGVVLHPGDPVVGTGTITRIEPGRYGNDQVDITVKIDKPYGTTAKVWVRTPTQNAGGLERGSMVVVIGEVRRISPDSRVAFLKAGARLDRAAPRQGSQNGSPAKAPQTGRQRAAVPANSLVPETCRKGSPHKPAR